jgi:hypothetical protein
MTLRTNILPRQTKKALEFLAGQKWLRKSGWYLAGGTALALYEGHRKSYDLDFFIRANEFAGEDLLKHFSKKIWTTDIVREGTIYGRLLGAKVSFIAYPFFHGQEKFYYYGAVPVLHPKDIAVMKIIAISQRGRKRDFYDLFWYIHCHEPLIDIIRRLPKQYPSVAHDYHHILKSLVYFTDADQDPLPKKYFSATWKQIKKYFEKEIPKITREVTQLT